MASFTWQSLRRKLAHGCRVLFAVIFILFVIAWIRSYSVADSISFNRPGRYEPPVKEDGWLWSIQFQQGCVLIWHERCGGEPVPASAFQGVFNTMASQINGSPKGLHYATFPPEFNVAHFHDVRPSLWTAAGFLHSHYES